MRGVVFGFLLGLVSACAPAAAPKVLPPSAHSPLLSGQAPELQQPALNHGAAMGGGVLSLRDLQGRIVIVDFFAQYCQPCVTALPDLEKLRRDRPAISIIGVAEDAEPERSLGLVQQLGLGFPVVHDRDHVLAGRYRIDELPATFVLDRGGVVRWAAGHCERRDLEAVLDSLR
jgi:cytochrome c biogenesis protein CcmG/thiol:disulfide interchange protein DsbE